MAQLARSYLSRCQDASLHPLAAAGLRAAAAPPRHVVSVAVPQPKIVPVTLHPLARSAASKHLTCVNVLQIQ